MSMWEEVGTITNKVIKKVVSMGGGCGILTELKFELLC